MIDTAIPRVQVLDALDLDALPLGFVSRVNLEVTQNGLGRPMYIPVLVARGEKPGPVFGITAALHGDELNGIPVIHRLFRLLDTAALRGTVVAAIVVNLPGYHANERQFTDRHDLNHLMPGKPHGHSAEVYAHRVIDRIVSRFNFLLDMHTASAGRVNSLYIRADMTHAVTARMAYLQRPQIIVHNPPFDGTLRGAAMAMGIPAITLEIGNPQRFQANYIQKALSGVRAVLSDLGMLPRRKLSLGAPPILCESSRWLYTDHGGLLQVFPEVTQIIEADELVGRVTNIFGDPMAEYRTAERGVVIGHSVNPVGHTGARILHLGRIAPEGHSFQPRPAPGDIS